MLHSNPPPPKGVPMKRKPVRGRGIKNYCFYDPHAENLFIYRGGELITQNRFTPLCTEEDLQTTDCIQCDKYYQPDKLTPRIVCLREMEDFKKTARGHSFCKNCNCNEINAYIVTNKNNLFSGYFCDPLYYPPIDKQVLFQEGYKKQLSNMFSRYNMSYLSKMSPI